MNRRSLLRRALGLLALPLARNGPDTDRLFHAPEPPAPDSGIATPPDGPAAPLVRFSELCEVTPPTFGGIPLIYISDLDSERTYVDRQIPAKTRMWISMITRWEDGLWAVPGEDE